MKVFLSISISLFLFSCNSDESEESVVADSSWPAEEIIKLNEDCMLESMDSLNLDIPCSCLVESVTSNIKYSDFKQIQNNNDGVFFPAEIEMQEKVLDAMISCVD
tara:strand:+ start:1141 stop:1455 length:315 start_codon:yes stop_codon:yes gene_type:complete